ncbi:MAG: hypothetical protein NTV58_16775 [Deltaproteobacteria bacterium]|nr:hypothetical protein [Deltaproteobacteria bacterium]
MKKSTKLFILGIALSIIPVVGAQAQTGLIIRAAVGVVKHFTSSDDDPGGYQRHPHHHQERGDGGGVKVQRQEVASVILEADADKVYAKSLKVVQENKKLHIIASNDESRTINFTDGERNVVMKVSRFQNNIAQILVSAVSTSEKASNTSPVVDGILSVCQEINTRCSVTDD